MPRDMDLIRDLLLRFEKDDVSIPEGCTQEEVAYHVKQMKLSGLIDATVIEAPSPGKLRPVKFIVHDITPAGHDFIAKIRNEGLWSKVKTEITKLGVPITIEVVKHVTDHVVKSLLP